MTRSAARMLPLYLALAVCGVAIAKLGGPYGIQLGLGVAITAILALSWDVLSRTGQVSLGQSAFFGLGAYASAMLGDYGIFVSWPGTVLSCCVCAILLGLLTLRLRQVYFSIATLGFALAMQVLVLIFGAWTGGSGGIVPPVIAGGDPANQLLIACFFLLIAVAASELFLSRRFRPAFFMIRTKPELAAANGVPVVRLKLVAFTVSGVLAGIAGALYGGLYGYIVPADVFTLNWSVLPLAIAILGGMDTTVGCLVGSVLLRALEELARAYVGGVGYQIVYGAVIILFISVMPTGIIGMIKSLVAWVATPRTTGIAHPPTESP
jgi:branched-chain amino acid transport system permease protein